ncbi:cation diffusion facilitator family transporter [Tsukamurella soli]|uniref:Cation diffusion facilitator family transporter n=1 Tax=Tsukamurella soli TaxID=644556 RepID=A0ABP8KEU7_9ACTN
MTAPSARRDLSRYALVSIAAAIVTIVMKVIAWRVSNSVGLLSDAAETMVNVVAAVGAYVALKVVARPADDDHNFGHTKAEYFSAVFEGVMIAVAAVIILVSAADRLLHPRPLDSVGLGLVIAVLATFVNLGVGLYLIRIGRRYRSLALEADGKHLMTDVWTTAGVVVGVLLVTLTGWQPLDSLVAIAMAVNILVVGGRLVLRSGAGLMDTALPDADRAAVDAVLERHRGGGVDFHDIRTRESGHIRFLQLHMLVPGEWTVQRAHDLVEEVEDDLRGALEDLRVTVHLEPIDDPRAYEPWRLD